MVTKRIIPRKRVAMLSNLSWPYWCVLSLFLLENLIPIITIIVLTTSDKEWTESLIIALDLPMIPAINLKVDNITLTIILIIDIFIDSL